MSELVNTPNGTDLADEPAMIRKDFGGTEITKRRETAATAMAAQARALIEARFTMAMHRPRDIMQARSRLLASCKRPGFAETARYAVPRGEGKVVGWSIRFAEEIIRSFGNITADSIITYDDEKVRVFTVTVMDLEANVSFATSVSIRKTMERRRVRPGMTVLSTRTNSYGDLVHVIPATDEEMQNKEASARSKAIRQGAIRLVPADILEECLEQVEATANNAQATDPDAAKKKLADAFAALSVMPLDLSGYLGHELGQCSPSELTTLRELYTAIKTGETSWAEVMAVKAEDRKRAEDDQPKEPKKGEAPKSSAELKARAKKQDQPPPQDDGPPPEHWEKMDKDRGQ